ncbi:MAG: TetR/AcrR family transcriptional regulator [Treponema sp.]|jgi:AcrR family transcriptional regulator|nr:TetR/AcrR family transcriptional regulator [Treponema sp.]
MGIIERKEREKAERKALIMRCTKDLILERGAEAVRMGEIAERAELSKATLYIYFPSKDILFREICIETGVQFIGYFRSLHKPRMPAVDSLKLFWKCYVDFFGKSDDMIVLFNMKQYLTPDCPFISIDDEESCFSIASYELFNIIRSIIKAGIDEGAFERDVNPTLVTHTIISLFSLSLETAVKFLKDPQELDRVFFDELRNIFQIILRGMAREGIERSHLALGDVRRTEEFSVRSERKNQEEENYAGVF